MRHYHWYREPMRRIAQSRVLAHPMVVDVLKRYPAAPPGRARVGELIRQVDASLRSCSSGRRASSGSSGTPGSRQNSRGLPPTDEQFLDRDALKAIGARDNQELIGPPLPPKP